MANRTIRFQGIASRVLRVACVFAIFTMVALWNRPTIAGIVLNPIYPTAVDNSYKSVSSNTPARIGFFNYCTYAVDVYWIDYSGNRQFYGYLQTGTWFTIDTFLTHPWLIVQRGTGGTVTQGTGTELVGFTAATPVSNATDYDIADICNLLKPQLSLSLPNYQSLTAPVGVSVGPITLLLRHTGSLGINIYGIVSNNPQEFKIGTSTCGSSIANGGSCEVDIFFSPAATGTRRAVITVTSSDAGSPHTISVAGTGATPIQSPPASEAPTASAYAVEYYYAGLDHYFVTSLSTEIQALDRGDFQGWSRTGRVFGVFTSAVPKSTPVCRFYIPPPFGNSHFYSASPAECSQVRQRFPQFSFETAAAMYVYGPDPATGVCPTASDPVYRIWNNRADTNHRYVTDLASRDYMVSRGYLAEGYGPDGVIFCAPKIQDSLRVLSKLRVPLVPGALDPNATYKVRWETSTGIKVETLGFLRLAQTLETVVPWIPGANPADAGGGFTGTYTVINKAGAQVMPPVTVSVSALPQVSANEAGYYTALLAAVTSELLVSHQNQPYAASGAIGQLIGASDDGYKNLLDTGSTADVALVDRIAKAMLETIIGRPVDPPITKAAGGPWWGSPQLLVTARSYANIVREATSYTVDLLAVGGAIAGLAGSAVGWAPLIAAGATVAGPISLVVGATGLIVAAGLNIAAASMLGKVADDDLVPVARSIADYGIGEIVGAFNGNFAETLCGSATGKFCEKIVTYGTGKGLEVAADISGWADKESTAAQRELGGIDDYVTPVITAAAAEAPMPTLEDYQAANKASTPANPPPPTPPPSNGCGYPISGDPNGGVC